MAKKNSSGGKSLAAHHGNERADSDMRVKAGSKAPSTMSMAPPSEAAEDGKMRITVVRCLLYSLIVSIAEEQ